MTDALPQFDKAPKFSAAGHWLLRMYGQRASGLAHCVQRGEAALCGERTKTWAWPGDRLVARCASCERAAATILEANRPGS